MFLDLIGFSLYFSFYLEIGKFLNFFLVLQYPFHREKFEMSRLQQKKNDCSDFIRFSMFWPLVAE